MEPPSFLYAGLDNETKSLTDELSSLGGGDAAAFPFEVHVSIVKNSTQRKNKNDRMLKNQKLSVSQIIWDYSNQIGIRDINDPRQRPPSSAMKYYNIENSARESDLSKNIEFKTSLIEKISQSLENGFNCCLLSLGKRNTGKTNELFGQLGYYDKDGSNISALMNEDSYFSAILYDVFLNADSSTTVALSCWCLVDKNIVDLVGPNSMSKEPLEFDSVECPNFEIALQIINEARSRCPGCLSHYNGVDFESMNEQSRGHFFARVLIHKKGHNDTSINSLNSLGSLSMFYVIDTLGMATIQSNHSQVLDEAQKIALRSNNNQVNCLYKILSEMKEISGQSERTHISNIHSPQRNSSSFLRHTSARDSKLTSLLAPIIQGNMRNFILARVEDSEESYSETKSLLSLLSDMGRIKAACYRMKHIPFSYLNLKQYDSFLGPILQSPYSSFHELDPTDTSQPHEKVPIRKVTKEKAGYSNRSVEHQTPSELPAYANSTSSSYLSTYSNTTSTTSQQPTCLERPNQSPPTAEESFHLENNSTDYGDVKLENILADDYVNFKAGDGKQRVTSSPIHSIQSMSKKKRKVGSNEDSESKASIGPDDSFIHMIEGNLHEAQRALSNRNVSNPTEVSREKDMTPSSSSSPKRFSLYHAYEKRNEEGEVNHKEDHEEDLSEDREARDPRDSNEENASDSSVSGQDFSNLMNEFSGLMQQLEDDAVLDLGKVSKDSPSYPWNSTTLSPTRKDGKQFGGILSFNEDMQTSLPFDQTLHVAQRTGEPEASMDEIDEDSLGGSNDSEQISNKGHLQAGNAHHQGALDRIQKWISEQSKRLLEGHPLDSIQSIEKDTYPSISLDMDDAYLPYKSYTEIFNDHLESSSSRGFAPAEASASVSDTDSGQFQSLESIDQQQLAPEPASIGGEGSTTMPWNTLGVEDTIPSDIQTLPEAKKEIEKLRRINRAMMSAFQSEKTERKKLENRLQMAQDDLLEAKTQSDIELDNYKLEMIQLKSQLRSLCENMSLVDVFASFEQNIEKLSKENEDLRQKNLEFEAQQLEELVRARTSTRASIRSSSFGQPARPHLGKQSSLCLIQTTTDPNPADETLGNNEIDTSVHDHISENREESYVQQCLKKELKQLWGKYKRQTQQFNDLAQQHAALKKLERKFLISMKLVEDANKRVSEKSRQLEKLQNDFSRTKQILQVKEKDYALLSDDLVYWKKSDLERKEENKRLLTDAQNLRLKVQDLEHERKRLLMLQKFTSKAGSVLPRSEESRKSAQVPIHMAKNPPQETRHASVDGSILYHQNDAVHSDTGLSRTELKGYDTLEVVLTALHEAIIVSNPKLLPLYRKLSEEIHNERLHGLNQRSWELTQSFYSPQTDGHMHSWSSHLPATGSSYSMLGSRSYQKQFESKKAQTSTTCSAASS